MGTVAVGPHGDRIIVGDGHPAEGWIVQAVDADQRARIALVNHIAEGVRVVRES